VVNMAYAQAAAPAADNPMGSILGNPLILMVLMVGIFYFLLIRPQQKKAKEHKALLDNLKEGDQVITSGGILGTVIKIDDQIVNLEIADRVRIKIARASVAGFAPKNAG
jgi:preprotein translocase subunit YajC